MLIFDTIVALSTPPYKSALAIVRLSGPKALEILSNITTRDVSKLTPNMSYFTKIYKDKNTKSDLIDECIITYYKGPKSYTGFDSVDFSLHGSILIVDELIETLVKYGARRANKGEFSAQAYYNGKIDLLKAEGINDLINANSTRARIIATNTLSGKNTEIITSLKNRLLEYLSQLEYFVEDQYSDEKDDYDEELDLIKSKLEEELSFINKTVEQTKIANKQYQGVNVAIVGKPNVGKSTLLNAIVGQDKAIVSPIPGTTRDIVEGEKEIKSILFRFKDTAGIRKTDDIVENLGIERSFKSIQDADLVLLVSDEGFKELDSDGNLLEIIGTKPVIKVGTKRDLNRTNLGADISICSLNDDLNPLIDLMFSKLNFNTKEEANFLGQREEDFLSKISNQINESINCISNTHQIDISSDYIRMAIATINDLMGNHVNQTMEDIYQTLFSKFCLGK